MTDAVSEQLAFAGTLDPKHTLQIDTYLSGKGAPCSRLSSRYPGPIILLLSLSSSGLCDKVGGWV